MEDRWDDWLVRRARQRNAESGKPWFLSSAPVPDAEKHNPSRLLKCHRKVFYQALNAPEEESEPRGVFFFGRRVEEDLVLPFLDVVTDEDTYIGNDLDVYFTTEHEGVELVFSGDTDPVLLDEKGQPERVTEVKTASSLPSAPRDHHLVQLYCYMRGMQTRYEQGGDTGLLLYVSRDGLDFRRFDVEWEQSVWEDVLDWAVKQTEYRRAGELPPAKPVHDWECDYCPFSERCRRDLEPDDGLVEDVEYPSRKLREWVAAADGDVVLPPGIGREHKELVEDLAVPVRGWRCTGCGTKIPWDDDRVEADAGEPLCPECAEDGDLYPLVLDDVE